MKDFISLDWAVGMRVGINMISKYFCSAGVAF